MKSPVDQNFNLEMMKAEPQQQHKKKRQGQGRLFLIPCVLGGPCQGVSDGSLGEVGWSRVNIGTPTSIPVFITWCLFGRQDFLLLGSG